jgi:putative ABC transport system permease protein
MTLLSRLRALVGARALDRDLDDEVRLHIELEAEDLARTRGLPADEARRQALIAFGGVERFKEAHRDVRGTRWLEELGQDTRYAVRGLVRSPGYFLSCVLLLTLGIGAVTAMFSAVNAVLLSRIPYPSPDQIVRIYRVNAAMNRFGLSLADYRAIEAQQHAFSAVGAGRTTRASVSAGGDPERVLAGRITAGFFPALGIAPAAGRGIEPGDERPGAPAVTLVSHQYAARALGGDDAAIGRSIVIDGVPHTVIGVLPATPADPSGLPAAVWPAAQWPAPTRQGPFGMRVIGRMRDGVTVADAERDLAGINQRLFPLWASSFQDSSATLSPAPLRDTLIGDARPTLWMFSAAAALVLLIAVANVASLTLVRCASRWHEVNVRTVLGATRTRLLRLMVTESLVVAAVGAALGIAAGALGLRVLAAVAPGLPRLGEVHLDLAAVAFAVGVAMLAAMAAGAYPVALLLSRRPTASLAGGSRTVGSGRRTRALRAAFVVAEFALALPLLAGAGLLLNSFLRLQRVQPGFDASKILSVSVSLPSAQYSGNIPIENFWRRALARVHEIPGVQAAGLGDAMPPNDQNMNINNFDLIDRPVTPGQAQPVAPWPTVTADYFAALGLRLLAGRSFSSVDDTASTPVVVVSRSWARKYFPDGSAIGRTLVSGGCTSCPPTVIVGVVDDAKYQGLDASGEAVYSSLSQGWGTDLNLFVRTRGNPAEAIAGVKAALRSVDPNLPLEDAATLDDRLYASIAQPKNWTRLVGGFALTALLLAAVGVFGMLSFTVNERRKEIGVRMALGAHPGEIVSLIVGRGMRHAAIGAALGLTIAVLATRRMAGALFNVSATDPLTLGGVTLMLLIVALVACWLPARRAAGIEPVEAIRGE